MLMLTLCMLSTLTLCMLFTLTLCTLFMLTLCMLLMLTLCMLTQALFSDAATTASCVSALAVVEFVSSPQVPAQFSRKLVLACWDFKASCCSRCSC